MNKRGRIFRDPGPRKKSGKMVPEKQIAWPWRGDRTKIRKPGRTRPQYAPNYGPQSGIANSSGIRYKQQLAKPANSFWIIVAIILIIVAIIIFVYYFYIPTVVHTGGGDGGGSGNDCTCYCGDGITVCTSNSQCPSDTSVPGTNVPGVCGCPVGC